MGKVLNGVVIDDDLFREYHKFQKGEEFDQKKIKQLLHYYKKEIVTNIRQYEDNDIELAINLKAQMVHSGLKRQSLEDLAENFTFYKIILSSSSNAFPYVNIMDDKQRLENNYSASYDIAEPRELAIKHLASICLHAKKIILYDKFFSQKESNAYLMNKILPQKKLEIVSNDIDDNRRTLMQGFCDQWTFTKNPRMTHRHDRYLIVDDKLEIILTSGFDHLNDTSGDFTYIVRYVDSPRFKG